MLFIGNPAFCLFRRRQRSHLWIPAKNCGKDRRGLREGQEEVAGRTGGGLREGPRGNAGVTEGAGGKEREGWDSLTSPASGFPIENVGNDRGTGVEWFRPHEIRSYAFAGFSMKDVGNDRCVFLK